VTIYLVRHAKAEEHAAHGGDAARSLTAEGQKRFEALAVALTGRMKVARIVTSPARRARQTADVLARHTGAPVSEEEALASGASDGRALLDLARRTGAGTALVGHNPEFAQAIALAAGREVKVKPGTVAAIELDHAGPRLTWLESPA
jgi:phosphohistidine phosphatase